MAKLFSAREIGVLALRKIGLVPGQDSSAPEGKLQIALQYLDMLLTEKAGTTRLWFFTPQSATFTYPAMAPSVDITSLLGPNNKLDFYRHAYIDTTDEEITLLRRDQFDEHDNSGLFPFITSRALYVATDGDDTYTAFMRPLPFTNIVVRVTGQKFSPTVAQTTNSSSEQAHGFEVAWQRWMVNALSVDIGDGPLARMPEDRLATWEAKAQLSWNQLNSYRGGGQRDQRRFTRAWRG